MELSAETTAPSSSLASSPLKARLRQLVVAVGLPLATLSLAVGIALLPLGDSGMHVVGYCLSSLVPFVLVAAQRREAIRIQAELGVVRGKSERWIAATLLTLGLLAAAAHAWQFAWAVS